MRRHSGPVKLDDCRVHGAGSGAELFVVEGDSAAAAVGSVRDPAFQAVLPMQGKPLNPLRATERRVGSHPLFLCLIDALGTGFGPAFDAAAIRFDRVLLLMDPDADGIHCGVLLAMFFHRWMRPLLDGGRIAIVRPPWGEVVGADAPLPHRAWSEQEFEALAGRLRSLGCVTARRYRGLAGIEAAVLRDTCVAPGSRRTERVTAAGVEAMIAVFQPSHGP